MYPKQVTELIVYYQALGFSAEETRTALKDKNSITINLNTIYKHRKSTVGQEITDELIRQQERDILKVESENKALALKYRNELLKLLIPFKTEILSKSLSINQTEVKHVIELVDPDNPTETYPPDEVQAAQRAGIIPPVKSPI